METDEHSEGESVRENQPDNGEKKTPLDEFEPDDEYEDDERYVAFPGGIPQKWFNTAYYVFLASVQWRELYENLAEPTLIYLRFLRSVIRKAE